MATSNSIITLRRHDLDNLRTCLTGLVIFHHTAISYGGASQGWRSRLVPFTAGTSSIPLAMFNAYNQAFFMGLFYWLSGHFSAKSLARHDKSGDNRWEFVREKAKRLALPAVVYTLTIMPAIKVIVLPEWTATAAQDCIYSYFRDLRGVRGAVWYVATLFVFDVVAAYVLPRAVDIPENKASDRITKKDSLYANLGKYIWLPVSIASFFIRTRFPVGKTIPPLGLQLAYVSQYIFAYSMGHLSVAKGKLWLSGPLDPGGPAKDAKESRLDFITASLLCVSSLAFCLLPSYFEGEVDWVATAVRDLSGGWNSSAMAYALWNELSFGIIGPALMLHFYNWYNKATSSSLWKPRYSYAAFLVHDLVVVAVEVALDAMIVGSGATPAWINSGLWKVVGPVLTTAAVGVINTAVSFGISKALIDNVSWLRRFI